MDNWMAPRAFAAAGGNNGKLSRQGKAAAAAATAVAAQAQASAPAPAPATAAQREREAGEESGASSMGMLKRKLTNPPESPAPTKKRVLEESSDSLGPGPSSSIREQSDAQGGGKNQTVGTQPIPGDSRVSKHLLGKEAIASVLAAEEVARSALEKDGDDSLNRSVENVSHGQGAVFQSWRPPWTSEPASRTSTMDSSARVSAITHRVPSHAGWFQWTRVHQLERLGLPEFFSGKHPLKTPETFMEHRNCIIMKYRENPQKLLKLEDVQESLKGDVSGATRLFGFLDHWGLINYQAISDSYPFQSSRGPLGSVEETQNGVLKLNPLPKPALANLFQFETAAAPPPASKLLSTPFGSASNLPLSSLAEAFVQESLAAPNVEYHCNSCQADCSKRRYHCQKQADFDLCPDCYSDGKFGQGMTGADFLRMDALTESADANGGGWSDQETLLLLEALEIYGENWNEIAEHVATKSKAQCILHFIRLPIEDPFLEGMEVANPGLPAQPPSTAVTDTNGAHHANNHGANVKAAENLKPPLNDAKEALAPNSEHDTAVWVQNDKDKQSEIQPTGKNIPPPKSETEVDMPASKSSKCSKAEESSVSQVLLAAAVTAGSAGPDGLIAFADAGNPVMAQVAFLAAMVGPRVAAAAAQSALKSLAEEDPVGYLSARNSFTLDSSDEQGGAFISDTSERLNSQLVTESQSPGGPPEPSDSNIGLTNKDTERKNGSPVKLTATVDETAGDGGVQKSNDFGETTTLSSTLGAYQDAPTVAKVFNAAASALASAAVKAKLLADQEEREIQRLVAGVIENQLKKLELKLKHFSELEALLGKECEQAEKARAKVYADRARIVASRLGSTPATSQVQSTSYPAQSYINTPPKLGSAVVQPRPAVFAFGAMGVSAPASGVKPFSEPEINASLPPGMSSEQPSGSQRLPRGVLGAGLTSDVK